MTLNRVYFLSIVLLLSACGTTPPPAPTPLPPTEQPPRPLPVDELRLSDNTLEALQNKRLLAAQSRQWEAFIDFSRLLWLQSDDEQQANIELDTWNQLQTLNTNEINQLARHHLPSLQEWAWLLQTGQQTGYAYKRELEDLQQLLDQAWFNRHLIPGLLAHYDETHLHPTIAVMLPFSDRYRAVSEQIRAGILKAYWQAGQAHSLLFFDLTENSDVVGVYEQAKQAGAQVIIGPLTRPSIEKLAQHQATNVIALNDLDRPTPFWQFNPRNNQENHHLIQTLQDQNYRHIALLATDRFLQQANDIQAQWNSTHPFPVQAHVFAENSPNLKAEISKLLQADSSEGRAGYLRRTIGRSLEFFPRTRQDIQAMILIGGEQEMAVIQPQFEYFDLKLPLYGTSSLTPTQLHAGAPNADLKHIQLQTLAAALTPSPLRTRLEAFGWDSYQLARHYDLITPEQIIHSAGGTLSLDQNGRIQTRLVWARYLANGQLVSLAPLDFYPNPPTNRETEAQLDSLREELLQEIMQLPGLPIVPAANAPE